MPTSDTEWIRELRDRTHKLISTCQALELNGGRVEKELNELSRVVGAMANADEIAKGVAEELRRRDVIDRDRAAVHRERIDAGIRRAVWGIGIVVTVFQILGFILK